MEIVYTIKDNWNSKEKVTFVATTHWKEGKRELKMIVKKADKTMTVNIPVHWGDFMKFVELVWRLKRDVEFN